MQADFEQYAGEIQRGLAEDRETFSAAVGGEVDAVMQDPQEWDPPIPFNEVRTPDFPTDCLPGPVADFVKALAETTQTPEEMGGLLALGVLATAYQDKYTMQITPDWWEPLCLYCVAVAPPGERKSAVISALMRPVYQYEAERREMEAAEIAVNRSERNILEEQVKAAEKAAIKGNEKGERERALNLAAQLAEFKTIQEYRLIANDTTPEKLIDLLDNHGGSLTIASSEGGVFDSMAGRYDKKLNLDVYLQAHAGDFISTDRIGRKGNSVSDPRLTMILTVQPQVIAGVIRNPAFKGRGLCGRFLYAMCKSKVGHRKISPAPIPPNVKDKYQSFVRSILSDENSGPIFLSREAFAFFQEFREFNEYLSGEFWRERGMSDWANKLEGATARIAGLIHAGTVDGNPAEIPIPVKTMEAAVSIARFLGPHAEAAYQTMGAELETDDAKYILKKLEGKDTITRTELTRLCRGRFKRANHMDSALNLLEERNYIRAVSDSIGYNSRNQLSYEINPLLYGK